MWVCTPVWVEGRINIPLIRKIKIKEAAEAVFVAPIPVFSPLNLNLHCVNQSHRSN